MTITVVSVNGIRTPAERGKVCYVGRAFAGWPASPLGNPFKGPGAVEKFRLWLDNHPDRESLLAAAWEACGRGVKPLGCWCLTVPWRVTPIDTPVCHAQVIAVELWRRVQDGVLLTGENQ